MSRRLDELLRRHREAGMDPRDDVRKLVFDKPVPDGQVESTPGRIAAPPGQNTENPFEGQIAPSFNLPPEEALGFVAGILGGTKKTRGRNKSTIRLVEAMRKIAEQARPISVRGIAYKLFAAGLIKNMGKGEVQKVSRASVGAREDGIIPWEWIVDETRELELIDTWNSARQFARGYFYRRDLWQAQKHRVEVWTEKGTVRGLLSPVLDRLGVGFRVMHGFSSATTLWEVCQNYPDNRPLVALYVGDWDPSGLCMSESDLPERIKEYGGHHIKLKRIALTAAQTGSLPSFSVETKKKDPRYKWFKKTYGEQCWELDAMDPNQLRDLVEAEINALIDPALWKQQEALQARETRALDLHLRWLKGRQAPRTCPLCFAA